MNGLIRISRYTSDQLWRATTGMGGQRRVRGDASYTPLCIAAGPMHLGPGRGPQQRPDSRRFRSHPEKILKQAVSPPSRRIRNHTPSPLMMTKLGIESEPSLAASRLPGGSKEGVLNTVTLGIVTGGASIMQKPSDGTRPPFWLSSSHARCSKG